MDTPAEKQSAPADMATSGDNSETERGIVPSTDQSKEESPPPPRTAHGIIWVLIVASILMANFLFATDNTIAANIQPAVIRQFNSLDKLAWLGVAFLAASWGANFFWGDLYARFSAKWTFCASFVVFSVGCAVAGAAPTMDALIVGRAICGMGGSGMYIGSMAILTKMTSERERPLYLNLVGITFGGGTVLGPIIGGGFAGSGATWRWAFYFNLVVGAVCAPIYIFLLPALNPLPGKSIKERLRGFDVLGNLFVIGLIVCIVMAITFGGLEYAWNSGQVIALFVLAFVLLWVFLIQQHFAFLTTITNRIFPMHFLKSATMVVLFLEVACCATCVFVPVYFLPLYFQFVKADSPILAGVRILPYVVLQSAIAITAGWAVGRTGYHVPWFIFAGVFCITGSALLYTVNQHTALANIYGYQVLLGLGSGAATQLTFAVASIKAKNQLDVGRSTGWQAFGQLGGPSISLGIANSVFLNKAHAALGSLLPDASIADINTIISEPNSRLLRDMPANMQNRVIDAVVSSMSNAYILCIVAGCFVLLLIFRFKVNDRLW
ncbi:major facilitator superfamily-domain-containing protein [Chaetomium fimeti]|uniref:Major facilitator superfamily-domain-containing protein n=1 Tax=Chaetomium fimeti TaxID=1854472 RepID=A0AAE0HC78_9PEZI|nr:major facilitator superfamily-domain-containing protein [Chaetomium fimeti]